METVLSVMALFALLPYFLGGLTLALAIGFLLFCVGAYLFKRIGDYATEKWRNF